MSDFRIETIIGKLISEDPKKKEDLLNSIKRALRLNKKIQIEDNNTIIVPNSENSVIMKQADENYVKAVLTEDKSNVNLMDSTEEEFKKADLEFRLYNILSKIRFFKNQSNPCIFEEDKVDGDIPYCPNDLHLAKFHGLKNEIKPGEEDDALLHVLQFYELLCSHLFQDIIDIASYLLGKDYNVESLEDRSNVADEIVDQIKKYYEGVPDTVKSLGGIEEYNSLRKTVNKIVSDPDQLSRIVEKVRKELGI